MSKLSKLIKNNNYNIIVNQKIVDAVEKYGGRKKLSEIHKNKMLILSSIIYWKMIRKYERSVEIPQMLLVSMFSVKNYKKIKNDCLKCTIEVTKKPHEYSHRCTEYRIKPKLYNEKLISLNPKLPKRFENKLKSKFIERYVKSEIFNELFDDNRVKIQNFFLEEILPMYSIDKVKTFMEELNFTQKSMARSMAIFEGFNTGKYFTSTPDKNGRLYNAFVYSRREFRGLIGDEYIELDICNSHPYILGSILKSVVDEKLFDFERDLVKIDEKFRGNKYDGHKDNLETCINTLGFIKNNILQEKQIILPKYLTPINNYNIINNLNLSICVYFGNPKMEVESKLKQEVNNFITLARKGIFYQEIATIYENNGGSFQNIKHLIKEDCPKILKLNHAELTKKQKKNIIKKCFMYWMNGKNDVKIKFPPIAVFTEIFPRITELISNTKKQFGKTCIHSLVTTVESNLVFKIVNEAYKNDEKNIIGTIHDGFYVSKRYLKLNETIMENISTKYLGKSPTFK